MLCTLSETATEGRTTQEVFWTTKLSTREEGLEIWCLWSRVLDRESEGRIREGGLWNC